MRKALRLALEAVVIVVLVLAHTAAASSLDYVWGTKPNIVVIRVENLKEGDQLPAGSWFQVTYRIAIKKWPLESESKVVDRVKEHFQKIREKIAQEYPNIRLYYAEYRYQEKNWKVLYTEYIYEATLIGRVEPTTLAADGNTTKLVSWIAVAIIVGLILAALVATIVILDNPAVQKLIVASAEALEAVATSKAMIYAVSALIFSIAILLAVVAIASLRRPPPR